MYSIVSLFPFLLFTNDLFEFLVYLICLDFFLYLYPVRGILCGMQRGVGNMSCLGIVHMRGVLCLAGLAITCGTKGEKKQKRYKSR